MDNGEAGYRRFLEGDEGAFDCVMEEYFCSLVFFIDRYLKDIHASEDAAMDVFTALIVYKHRYNFKTSLKSYLFMLGRSKALDVLRKRKRRRESPLEEAEMLPDMYKGPFEKALDGEIRRKVNDAIQSLPKEMQAAVHLVYFEGLSYKEAARVMRKTGKQMDNLLYRAKKALRSLLGKDGERLL